HFGFRSNKPPPSHSCQPTTPPGEHYAKTQASRNTKQSTPPPPSCKPHYSTRPDARGRPVHTLGVQQQQAGASPDLWPLTGSGLAAIRVSASPLPASAPLPSPRLKPVRLRHVARHTRSPQIREVVRSAPPAELHNMIRRVRPAPTPRQTQLIHPT